MKASEIISAIESNKDRFEWFGLRAVTMNPITRSFETLEVGQTAPVSYSWDDGSTTDWELPGTSALKIERDAEIEDAQDAIDQIGIYDDRAQVILLGSLYMQYGDDNGEIVMRNAEVIAECKK